jgi:hypothetical protein
MRHRYGITVAEWNGIVAAQMGRCQLCHEVRKLVPDHDHATGKFRAGLCQACNVGMGNLGDNPQRLREAAAYLEGR